MQMHYQTVTLSKLALAFNYSERQIIRIFKKNTGKGFSELLTEIRMNKAIQLLKNKDIPINGIASMLGYSSTYYFNKSISGNIYILTGIFPETNFSDITLLYFDHTAIARIPFCHTFLQIRCYLAVAGFESSWFYTIKNYITGQISRNQTYFMDRKSLIKLFGRLTDKSSDFATSSLSSTIGS